MANKNDDNTKGNNTPDSTAKNTKDNNTSDNTDKRGFASMPHEKVVEIASKGGQASGGNKSKEEKKS